MDDMHDVWKAYLVLCKCWPEWNLDRIVSSNGITNLMLCAEQKVSQHTNTAAIPTGHTKPAFNMKKNIFQSYHHTGLQHVFFKSPGKYPILWRQILEKHAREWSSAFTFLLLYVFYMYSSISFDRFTLKAHKQVRGILPNQACSDTLPCKRIYFCCSTAVLSLCVGSGGIQSTGQTCWHCGWSKCPTHSVQRSGSIW